MYLESYKELIVWQKSIDLIEEIYNLTSKLPKEETYGLSIQIRRAAISIPSNIAEVQRRKDLPEFLHFLRIADASSAELETQIVISKRLYHNIDYSRIDKLLEEIQKMLNVMISRLKLKAKNSQLKAFSLIETIIYAALISIIIGMVLLVVFQIVESQDRSRAKTEVEEETNFLISKIKWALSGVDVINAPASGASGSTLSVNKFNFSQNPAIIDTASGSLRMTFGTGAPAILNSGAVSIANISFQHISQTTTTSPAIKTILTTQFNPRGAYRIYETSSTVETTIYLRK